MSTATLDTIDVRTLLKKYTVEELNRTADKYFQQFQSQDSINWLLAKPFISPEEMPEVLISFCHVFQGLQMTPGMTVLDFGAGSCWSSRFLTQLGYNVIACDVSEHALEIGKRGFQLFPIQGKRSQPRFLHFDGHRFDLPDHSVDRIMCLSAFHHVPNQEEVLAEMARVLKDGGIAGFAEPGPNHSKTAQAQEEMRNFTVIENDIHLEEIWEKAKRVGFADLEVGLWTPSTGLMSLDSYNAFLAGHFQAANPQLSAMTLFLRDRRLFFLHRQSGHKITSRQAQGLKAEIQVHLDRTTVPAHTPIPATVRLRNTGTALWLPSSAPNGPVRLGVRKVQPRRKNRTWEALAKSILRSIRKANGSCEYQDITRFPLPGPAGRGHEP
ncbi:MAG: class I SAM-dependent methyltransferase, partial [Gemmataceae bacterium]